MSRSLSTTLAVAAFFALSSAASAGTIIFTPVNPAFGGNPLNGSWLLSQAQAQNQFAQSNSSASAALTPSQQFASELTSQLYASLANQITQAIFGPNAQTSGTYSFGGTTVSFQTVGGQIEISVNDGTSITNISVPSAP